MTIEEFKNYYEKHGKCLGQMTNPKHKLSEKEIIERYNKFCKEKNSKIHKGTYDDSMWKEVSSVVWKRDNSQCQLMKQLTLEEKNYIISTCPISIINTLDLAHIISRTNSKNLYYNPDNIILLSRVFHSRLDSYHDPITGKQITLDENIAWWKKIVGEDRYNKLLKNK